MKKTTYTFTVTDYKNLTDLDNWKINGGPNVAGVYVLAPFENPYYTGMTTKNGTGKQKERGVFKRIDEHLNNIRGHGCTYLIFKHHFYTATVSQRKNILPRAVWPTNPLIFQSNAKDNVIFWREKVGFMNPNDLINPNKWDLPISNLKYPLRQEAMDVIHEVFSLANFKFFYIPVTDEGLQNNSEFLECLESIVKFSLEINTAGKSEQNINSVPQILNSLGIAQIDIHIPNPAIKKFFYSSPHDENYNQVLNLKGIVNIL